MEMTVREIVGYITKATGLANKLNDEFICQEKEEITLNKYEVCNLRDILDNYCCILRKLKVKI